MRQRPCDASVLLLAYASIDPATRSKDIVGGSRRRDMSMQHTRRGKCLREKPGFARAERNGRGLVCMGYVASHGSVDKSRAAQLQDQMHTPKAEHDATRNPRSTKMQNGGNTTRRHTCCYFVGRICRGYLEGDFKASCAKRAGQATS